MYAIVEIAGQQFKVAKDQKVFVHRLPGEEGDNISFERILLTGDGDKITLGAPAIEGALVGAKITRHLKGEKVIVFKKKRRKGYRVKNGHRQSLTEILIESISVNGKKDTAKKNSENSVKEEKTTPKKTTPNKEKKETSKPSKEEELNNHTVVELREMAKDKGVEGYSSMKKAELVDALSK